LAAHFWLAAACRRSSRSFQLVKKMIEEFRNLMNSYSETKFPVK
jgi:hypothetical protein